MLASYIQSTTIDDWVRSKCSHSNPNTFTMVWQCNVSSKAAQICPIFHTTEQHWKYQVHRPHMEMYQWKEEDRGISMYLNKLKWIYHPWLSTSLYENTTQQSCSLGSIFRDIHLYLPLLSSHWLYVCLDSYANYYSSHGIIWTPM